MFLTDILTPIMEKVQAHESLFHGTDCDRAAVILDKECLLDRTEHKDHLFPGVRAKDRHTGPYTTGTLVKGVSTTRSKSFAKSWRQAGVVFELNGALVRQHNRVLPIDYHQGDKRKSRTEAEEFVVGAIKPLSRCLIAIWMAREEADACREDDKQWEEGHKPYAKLLDHPLLRFW